MTPKQILDSFSETLMQDAHILSPQERALVTTLLQHAKAATAGNPETQEAVNAVIASAVGETVAQRAFAVLGGSIVERILEGCTLPLGDSSRERTADALAGSENLGQPQPPSGPGVKAPRTEPKPPSGPRREPRPPSHGPGVRPPHKEPHRPQRDTPVAPSPKQPQPPSLPMEQPQPPSPHGVRTTVLSETKPAVGERALVLPAQCVVLDEFLAPQELDELTR